jgi:3,4-dihydroxy 2-butanone 4-phosphate synthase/GTP cyclohydrolase II
MLIDKLPFPPPIPQTGTRCMRMPSPPQYRGCADVRDEADNRVDTTASVDWSALGAAGTRGDTSRGPLASVEKALEQLRAGRFVLVVDDEDRENEGDLIIAAELMTVESMAFMIRHTSGLICVGMTSERLDELALPQMVERGDDPRGTAFAVSVDLKAGTTTGISAADRSRTARALADPSTRATDFSRPGHLFPLRARPGGVLKRAGHTEAAVDLCRMAGLRPAGVLAEVTNDDGTMSSRAQLDRFADEHELVLISVADIVRSRHRTESLIRRTAMGRVPTAAGEFSAITYQSVLDDVEHVALVMGDVGSGGDVLVRVHSECLTGDVFGSRRCDCGAQLSRALTEIAVTGRGVVVYLRGQEGRGIGLSHKLRAYQLQDAGLDTVDANLALGLPVDTREYGIGAQILRDLGVTRLSLMTNNPAKHQGLQGYGLTIVSRIPILITPNGDNLAYLRAKQNRLNHDLEIESST